MEALIDVDTILFDKTGTLTNAEMRVERLINCGEMADLTLLAYSAAAESRMDHPIAKAILQHAAELEINVPDVTNNVYRVGYGISVSLDSQLIRVGSERFMLSESIVIPDDIKQAIETSSIAGNSLILIAREREIVGAIELASVVRMEVEDTIRRLKAHGIEHMAIVSGDHEYPTKRLAEDLGMDDYFYNVLPEEKAEIVEKLQSEGRKVCFIGDGINDAIALQKADVSISLAGATTVAIDVADIILMEESLTRLADLFDISNSLRRNQNNSLNILAAPSSITITGALFFGLGFVPALLIRDAFFFVGLGNSVWPMIRSDPRSLNLPQPKTAALIESNKSSGVLPKSI